MATQVGIRLSLTGAQQTEAGLRRVASSVDQVGVSAVAVRGAVTRLAGAFAGVVSVGAFAQAADAVTTLNNQLRLASGSASSAATAYSALFDIAQKSRVSFTELGGTFASITRATQEMGLSQKQVLDVTEAIANAITVSGASASASQAALIQLGQGLASGVLRGEELNSVMEQTPRLARALADGLNVPIGKLREMGKAGELTAEAVIGALRSQGAVLAGEVAQSTLTVSQAFTQLQNAAIDATGKIDAATGASDSLAKAIQGTAAAIRTLGDVLAQHSDLIKTTFGAVSGAAVAAGLATVAANIGKIRIAFLGLTAAMAANPVTLALLGLGAVAGAMIANPTDKYTSIREQLDATNKLLANGNLEEDRRNRLMQRRLQLEGELAKFLNSNAGGGRGFVNPDVVRQPRTETPVAGKGGKTKDVRDQLSEAAKDYARVMEAFASATAAAEAEALGLTKTQAKLREILADPSWEQFSRQQQEQVIYMAGVAEAAEESAAAVAKRKQAEEEAAQAQAAYNRNLAQTVQAAIEEADAAEEKLRTYGMLESQVQELTLAKLQEQAATFELTAAELKSIELRIDAQKRLIEATKRMEARIASDKASEVAERAAKESEEIWRRSAERIGDSITDALLRGFEAGKGFAENLRDTIKNLFQTLVLRPVVQAVVMPVAGGLASLFGAPASAATSGSGMGMLGNVASLGGSIFGAGGLGGSLAAGAGWLTGASTFGGSLAAAGSLIGTGTGAGIASGLGMAAGALGPIALGALALRSIFGGRGETRSGGQYAGTSLISGPSGGEINGQATRDAIATTQSSINDLLRQLGSSTQVAGLYSGLESSEKGKGFAYAGARLSNGAIVGQGADGLGYMNRRGSKTPEEASKEFAEELKQVTIQTLQAADVPGQLGEYLRSLGDIDKLSGGALDAVFNRINKALTERQALEDRLFDLTSSEAEKLTRMRERERAAIDATNLSLLEQVYQQEDLRAAQEAATRAAQEAARAAEEHARAVADQAAAMQRTERDLQERLYRIFEGAMGDIADEVRRLTGSGIGSKDMNSLQAQFAITTAQARAMDPKALERLPELSRAIEGASLGSARSRDEFERQQARLAASLSETLTVVSGQLGPAPSTKDVVDELKAARELLAETRTENQEHAAALVRAMNKFTQIVSRWDIDGMPDVRELA